MGQIAAQVFLEQIENKNQNVKTEKQVVLTPELYIRSTSTKKGTTKL